MSSEMIILARNEILFHFLSYTCDANDNVVPMATSSSDIQDLPDHPFQPASFQFPLHSLGKTTVIRQSFQSLSFIMVNAHSYVPALHLWKSYTFISWKQELKTSFFDVQ